MSEGYVVLAVVVLMAYLLFAESEEGSSSDQRGKEITRITDDALNRMHHITRDSLHRFDNARRK